MDHDRKIHRPEKPIERSQEQIVAPETDEQPKPAAEQGEEHAFAEQLPNDSPAARAERQPKRDLLRAIRAPGQEHVREVEAGDEQDRAGHGEE